MRWRARDLAFFAAAAAAFAAAVVLQIARDRFFPRDMRQVEQILYVRSGSALKRMTLSFDALAADVYWIRAIQHYGGDRLSGPQAQTKYQLLYPLLDLTTTLDPYFNIAYRFGAIFLSEAYPGGPGRPDQSVALLRKAIVAMPSRWQYYHDIGFVYYWRFRDYHDAALWFQRAAEKPNAPIWLKPLAAAMLSHGEDRAAARFLWQQIAQSEEPWLRRNAERALRQLQALDQIDQLNAVVGRYPPSSGEPRSWEDLVRRRVLVRVPYDPTGTPYEIDPATGRVSVSARSPLFPMPQEPRRLQ
jgi:tetratricopeptide (TPR) repeat protein